jgi:hypothetical protein
MTRFTVYYRRSILANRVYRVTVTASDPDEARAKAAIRDPEYTVSVAVKNRGLVREAVVS